MLIEQRGTYAEPGQVLAFNLISLMSRWRTWFLPRSHSSSKVIYTYESEKQARLIVSLFQQENPEIYLDLQEAE